MEPSKDLSALLDRSEADVRGMKRPDSGSVRSSLSTPPTLPSTGDPRADCGSGKAASCSTRPLAACDGRMLCAPCQHALPWPLEALQLKLDLTHSW